MSKTFKLKLKKQNHSAMEILSEMLNQTEKTSKKNNSHDSQQDQNEYENVWINPQN